MPEVSVIVVAYNSAGTIRRCLASLPREAEVIVVDNASVDGTAERVRSEFASVRLIENASNMGFGAANNVALRLAGGRYALLLNPDAWAEEDAVEALARFMDEHPEAAACGGMLRFPDGRPQKSAARELTLWRVFCEQTMLEKIPGFSPYWHSSGGGARVVEQVMGACMMLRRGQSGEFPLFDERFFLYCEDTELCKRLAGPIWYVPEAVFGHELGVSSEGDRASAISFYNRGKELYFRIHHGKAAAGVCLLFNRLGAALRLLIWGAAALMTLGSLPRFVRRAGTFWKVLSAPRRSYDEVG